MLALVSANSERKKAFENVKGSDGFYTERAERSLQPPLQKCRKAAPPKKCRKEARLKICSKCSPPQKCCKAALQKVPCYV